MIYDLISRQAAIDLPRNTIRNFRGEIVKESIDIVDIERLPSAQEEKWISEIREAYDRAKANPYIRKPISRALYEVWHRYDQTEVERR